MDAVLCSHDEDRDEAKDEDEGDDALATFCSARIRSGLAGCALQACRTGLFYMSQVPAGRRSQEAGRSAAYRQGSRQEKIRAV